MRHPTPGVLSIALALALVPAAAGQVVTATLYGTVLDPNGGAVPNARVTATNTDRGTAITRDTDGFGQVTLTSLPIGNYVISIETPGFKSLRQSGIALSAGEDLRIDFRLELGQVTERVDVTAEAEVNLAKGIASAEIANTMSGNVNIITKSGTNDFHGSVFWLNNTENFNARLQFLQICARSPSDFSCRTISGSASVSSTASSRSGPDPIAIPIRFGTAT
jgi:hypothetical protein